MDFGDSSRGTGEEPARGVSATLIEMRAMEKHKITMKNLNDNLAFDVASIVAEYQAPLGRSLQTAGHPSIPNWFPTGAARNILYGRGRQIERANQRRSRGTDVTCSRSSDRVVDNR